MKIIIIITMLVFAGCADVRIGLYGHSNYSLGTGEIIDDTEANKE